MIPELHLSSSIHPTLTHEQLAAALEGKLRVWLRGTPFRLRLFPTERAVFNEATREGFLPLRESSRLRLVWDQWCAINSVPHVLLRMGPTTAKYSELSIDLVATGRTLAPWGSDRLWELFVAEAHKKAPPHRSLMGAAIHVNTTLSWCRRLPKENAVNVARQAVAILRDPRATEPSTRAWRAPV